MNQRRGLVVACGLCALLGACGPGPFNYLKEPVREAQLALDDPAQGALCAGEQTQLRLRLAGPEGREVFARQRPPGDEARDPGAPVLLWDDVALESAHGRVEAGGRFWPDDDVLRAFSDGYTVNAALRERPEVSTSARFPATTECLRRLRVGLLDPADAATPSLELSLAYIADERGEAHALIRLDSASSVPGMPPYVILPPGAARPFELHLEGADPQAFASQIVVRIASEHPELLDLVSFIDADADADADAAAADADAGREPPRQITSAPRIIREPVAELFAREREAGHAVR